MKTTASQTQPSAVTPEAIDLDGLLRRLHLPTIRRLYLELENRAEVEEMSYRNYLALLVSEEVAHRAETRIQRATRKANFPFLRTIEEYDFKLQTAVRRSLLGSYLGPELVSEGRCLILGGSVGTGKTHLSVAVAYRAIQNGYDACFTTAAELIDELSGAAGEGWLRKALAPYLQAQVLVIDEVGYLTTAPTPPTGSSRWSTIATCTRSRCSFPRTSR